MRSVIALFDAPIPSSRAVHALRASGFADGDISVYGEACVPGIPTSMQAVLGEPAEDRIVATGRPEQGRARARHAGGASSRSEADRDRSTVDRVTEESLARRLIRKGLSRVDADTCARGAAERGAILVVVDCPTLSSPVAQAILTAACPPDLATHRGRWDTATDARYCWSQVAPPT